MKRLHIMLIVLAGVIALGLYFFVFKTEKAAEVTLDDSGVQIEQNNAGKGVDLKILEDPSFLDLKVFSDLPVRTGELGNDEPIVD